MKTAQLENQVPRETLDHGVSRWAWNAGVCRWYQGLWDRLGGLQRTHPRKLALAAQGRPRPLWGIIFWIQLRHLIRQNLLLRRGGVANSLGPFPQDSQDLQVRLAQLEKKVLQGSREMWELKANWAPKESLGPKVGSWAMTGLGWVGVGHSGCSYVMGDNLRVQNSMW